jgi:hypothetical protein
MKYIVLYTFAIWLLVNSEATAQKPVIDLLPSDHKPIHQNAVADTGFVGDSLVEVLQEKVQVERVIPHTNLTSESSNVGLNNKSRNTGLVRTSIMNRLVLSVIKSNRYLKLYITALKK